MNLLPLSKLGPHAILNNKMSFGLYLPWVSAAQGNQLFVKIIHEQDQFIKTIKPKQFELSHSVDPIYGDYWSTTVTIDAEDAEHTSHWGQKGSASALLRASSSS
jgi:hypothetical protein